MIKGRFSSIIGYLILLSLIACQSTQTSIRKVASLNIGTAYRVFIQDDFAYVATNYGVVIVDIHQRNKPKKNGSDRIIRSSFWSGCSK